MSIIDRVVRRFDAVSQDPVAVVPEWSDESGRPALVYSEPWTVRDHERFAKVHGGDKDWAADVVVAKAKDESGASLFNKEDVVQLQARGERHVVMRVAEAIMYSMALDDAKKNSPLSLEETQSPEL